MIKLTTVRHSDGSQRRSRLEYLQEPQLSWHSHPACSGRYFRLNLWDSVSLYSTPSWLHRTHVGTGIWGPRLTVHLWSGAWCTSVRQYWGGAGLDLYNYSDAILGYIWVKFSMTRMKAADDNGTAQSESCESVKTRKWILSLLLCKCYFWDGKLARRELLYGAWVWDSQSCCKLEHGTYIVVAGRLVLSWGTVWHDLVTSRHQITLGTVKLDNSHLG